MDGELYLFLLQIPSCDTVPRVHVRAQDPRTAIISAMSMFFVFDQIDRSEAMIMRWGSSMLPKSPAYHLWTRCLLVAVPKQGGRLTVPSILEERLLEPGKL